MICKQVNIISLYLLGAAAAKDWNKNETKRQLLVSSLQHAEFEEHTVKNDPYVILRLLTIISIYDTWIVDTNWIKFIPVNLLKIW